MIAPYIGVAVLVAASAIVGQGVLSLSGWDRWSWVAPAVGLATLEVVCLVFIRVPGRDVAAIIAIACVLVAAMARLVRVGLRFTAWRPLVVAGLPVAGASLPFLANGRVGLPGVSLDNDIAFHLVWAEGLRSSLMSRLYRVSPGYPLGPHSLVATLASSTGLRMDHAFMALLIGVLAITALAAAGSMPRAALWRTALVALLAALGYLSAAYYGQASFKEIMMGLFVLSFAVLGREVASQRRAVREPIGWLRVGITFGLLAAGVADTYSYLGLAWLGGFLGLWLFLELLGAPSLIADRVRRHRSLLSVAAVGAGGLVVLVIALLPTAQRVHRFLNAVGTNPAATGAIPTGNIGNLAGRLSPYEGLGIWNQADYRFAPTQAFHAGELASLALAVLIFGALWHVRRRDFALPAAVGICAMVWAYTDRTQSAYVSAKALVIATPVVMLLGSRALLAAGEDSRPGLLSGSGPSAGRLRTVLGLVFAGFALYSSSLALRGEPVGAPEPGVELGQMRSVIKGRATLFLGNDDFAPWYLRGVRLAFPQPGPPTSPTAISLARKPWQYGQPFDFDSVSAATLDQHAFVITTNSPYASQVPPNFRLVRSFALYRLWQRVGPTAPRSIIEPGGIPAAIVDCRTAQGARLSRAGGVASVMVTPAGVAAPPGLQPNGRFTVALPLPAGDWDLSATYTSNEKLKLSANGANWELPANLGRPGPYYYFGSVHSSGPASPVLVHVYEDHPSRFSSPKDVANVSSIAATHGPDTRTIVPLSRSCGRDVDWYRTG
jgi:hypothetical protein